VAALQALCLTLNGGGGQQAFWDNVERAAHKAKMAIAK